MRWGPTGHIDSEKFNSLEFGWENRDPELGRTLLEFSPYVSPLKLFNATDMASTCCVSAISFDQSWAELPTNKL